MRKPTKVWLVERGVEEGVYEANESRFRHPRYLLVTDACYRLRLVYDGVSGPFFSCGDLFKERHHRCVEVVA